MSDADRTPLDEDTIAIEDTASGQVFELTEAGEQTRTNQILQSQHQARRALYQLDDAEAIYRFVAEYVGQFLGLAREHGYQEFLSETKMGEIRFERDVVPQLPAKYAKRDPRPSNPGQFPIEIRGARKFTRLNDRMVECSVSAGELSSGRETRAVSIAPPKSVSMDAFEVAERLQNSLGLEIRPGEVGDSGGVL